MVQSDEKALEQRKTKCEKGFKKINEQIDEVKANIVDLQKTQETLKQKLRFLSGSSNINLNKMTKATAFKR